MNKHWKKIFTLGINKVQKTESELKYTYVAESAAEYKSKSETQNLEFRKRIQNLEKEFRI